MKVMTSQPCTVDICSCHS